MKLTLIITTEFDDYTNDVITELQYHCDKLYNILNYEYHNGNVISFFDSIKTFKSSWHFSYLQAHTYQSALKSVINDWKSYFSLVKLYNNNKVNKPGKPRYKSKNRHVDLVFSKTAVRVKNSDMLLSIGKSMKKDKSINSIKILLSDKVKSLLDDCDIKQVKLRYKTRLERYEVLIIYEIKDPVLKTEGDVMSIDLGVNNLAAITFLNQNNQYLIDGKVLKSRITTYNNWLKESYSSQMKITASNDFKVTNKIYKEYQKKNNYVKNYIHQSSNKIINLAKEHNVRLIIIGDFKGIKLRNRIKCFVQIPHTKLREQIEYKAKKSGIEVRFVNESYTSTVSSVDLEPVTKEYSNKKRRIKRGLFKSSYGLINSDINGSLNILRKHITLGDNIPKLINEVRDKGFARNPKRLLIV